MNDIRAATTEGAPGAMAWRDLIMRNAGNIVESLKDCQPVPAKNGGHACLVPLWTEPPPVPKGQG